MNKRLKYGGHEVRITFSIIKEDGTKHEIDTVEITSFKSDENACRAAIITEEVVKEFLELHTNHQDDIEIDVEVCKIRPNKVKRFRRGLKKWLEETLVDAYETGVMK